MDPDICFALGDFKTEKYKLAEGFQHLKIAIEKFKLRLANGRQLRLNINPPMFEGKWSKGIAFALVFRKYLFQAFISGTNRVFVSDHEKFTGFFQYEFKQEDQMSIKYFVINNPETTEHGITLMSAIAGFFYRDIEEALETKMNLALKLEVAARSVGTDPLREWYGGSLKSGSLKSSKFVPTLPSIKKSD